MNYQVNAVAASTGGYGFSITDSRSIPLVHFEFEHEDKAKEAQRIIGQIIAIATKTRQPAERPPRPPPERRREPSC